MKFSVCPLTGQHRMWLLVDREREEWAMWRWENGAWRETPSRAHWSI